MTKTKNSTPDFLFETSWEVCNKVGGIYTVLSTRANTLLQQLPATTLAFIGPELGQRDDVFMEDILLLTEWKQAAEKENLRVRIGRWNVPGQPIAVLVDFQPYFEQKNEIYAQAWELFHVDSMRAYGDYDEASMFSYAAGRFAEAVVKHCLKASDKVVYQAHEWMSGLGMLFLGHNCPQVATIFTTHATSMGRSIAGNNKLLYEYFEGYNGDQMAAELNMQSKHSLEKAAAHAADCFTTVSDVTAEECAQLLERRPDVVTPNGFEPGFVPAPARFIKARAAARVELLKVARALTGRQFTDDTFIVATSGRCEFRNKGIDVFCDAMARLTDRGTARQVLAFVMVPAWCAGPRADLSAALANGSELPLSDAVLTHNLHNYNDDPVCQRIHQLGFAHENLDGNVTLIYVPCYLNGTDGIFNRSYYELLIGMDLTVFPSYYEPWGYTPLESVAFGVPTITTSLSGFGQWARTAASASFADCGVEVIERTDSNYDYVADAIAQHVQALTAADTRTRALYSQAARATAAADDWSHFIIYYTEAFGIALRNNKKK